MNLAAKSNLAINFYYGYARIELLLQLGILVNVDLVWMDSLLQEERKGVIAQVTARASVEINRGMG